jgi:hypothetical protein
MWEVNLLVPYLEQLKKKRGSNKYNNKPLRNVFLDQYTIQIKNLLAKNVWENYELKYLYYPYILNYILYEKFLKKASNKLKEDK